MEYVYAAMLLHKTGKPITEAALKDVLNSAGVQVDEAKVKATCAALKDVKIDEVIAKASFAAPAAAPAGPSASAAEKKKEPEEKQVSVEEAAAGLGALFG